LKKENGTRRREEMKVASLSFVLHVKMMMISFFVGEPF
jgi:hypothetical protein